MRFKINEGLREKVVSKIPEGLNKLQICMFVYAELCRTLEYSVAYYVNQKKYDHLYTNVCNLEQIDGTERKDVTCFTLDAIYQEIIEGLNMKGVEFIDQFQFKREGVFMNAHHKNLLMVEGIYCEVDPTFGVLANNDLLDLKFAGRTIKGFKIEAVPKGINKDVVMSDYQRMVDFLAEDTPLSALVLDYQTQKAEEYRGLSIEERFDLFMKMLKHTPGYSITSLNYILNLKSALFSRSESSYDEENVRKQYLSVGFVRETGSGELRVLIMFNKDGKMLGRKNSYDNLQTFEYSLKNNTAQQIDKDKLMKKIKADGYYSLGYHSVPIWQEWRFINMIEGYMP